MDKQILDEYKNLKNQNLEQNYLGMFFHPEGGGDFFVNEGLEQIRNDLLEIDACLVKTGKEIENLLSKTSNRLKVAKDDILTEKERFQDMMMLCNKYTDFDSVKSYDLTEFDGSYMYSDGVISAPIQRSNEVTLVAFDVQGNGYEGNGHVYIDGKYQAETFDTSKREHMFDKSVSTYYEYSRLIVDESNRDVSKLIFNRDNEYALCTLFLQAEELVNYIEIHTEERGLKIIDIRYSVDNVNYKQLDMPTITINDVLDSYKNYGYVYGSGKISVPTAQYFKITMQSNSFKNDPIAYDKVIYEDANVDKEGSIPRLTSVVQEIPEARRSVIRINEIKAYKNVYSAKMSIVSKELITAPAYSIALFCNIYIPGGLENDAVKFKMYVDGVEYDIVPINSDMNGIKVIRFSGGKSSSAYTALVSEVIKSAKLNIIFKGKSSVSPYINNLKILIGGEI